MGTSNAHRREVEAQEITAPDGGEAAAIESADNIKTAAATQREAAPGGYVRVPAGTRGSYGLSVTDNAMGLHAPAGSTLMCEPEVPAGAGLAVLWMRDGKPLVVDLTHDFRPDFARPISLDSGTIPLIDALDPASGRGGRVRTDRIAAIHAVVGIYTPADVMERAVRRHEPLPIMTSCPAGMGEHRAADVSAYPLVRKGETVIFDPAKREVREGALCVLEWREGSRSICLLSHRRDAWFIDPVNRPPRGYTAAPIGGILFASDGPYTAGGLAERIVGRVVGVLVPGRSGSTFAVATDEGQGAAAARASSPIQDMSALVGAALVDGGLTSEISEEVCAAIEEHAEAIATGLAEPDTADAVFDRHMAREKAADEALKAVPARSLADLRAKLTYLLPIVAPDMLDQTHVAHLEAIRIDMDRLCRERSRSADTHEDAELLRLGEEIDRAQARWRIAAWQNREPQQRLGAFLDAAEKRPGGATVRDHHAAWDLPGVREANEAQDEAYNRIWDLGNKAWKIPASTPAGVAVKARLLLATYFSDGDYEDRAAEGENEEVEPRSIRELIEACCTLAGVDWRGDPIAPPVPDPIYPAIERHLAARTACLGLDDGEDEERYEAAHARRREALTTFETTRPSTVAGLLAMARHIKAYLTEDGEPPTDDLTARGLAFSGLLDACTGLFEARYPGMDRDWAQFAAYHPGFLPVPQDFPAGLLCLDRAIPQEARRLLDLAEAEFERRRQAYVGFHDPTVWPRVAANLRRDMRMDALALVAAPLGREISDQGDDRDAPVRKALMAHEAAHRRYGELISATGAVERKAASGEAIEADVTAAETVQEEAGDAALQAWRDLFKVRPRSLHQLWLFLRHCAEHYVENTGINDEPDVFGELAASVEVLRLEGDDYATPHDLTKLSIRDLEWLNDTCHHQGRALDMFHEAGRAAAPAYAEILHVEGQRLAMLGDAAVEELRRRTPTDERDRDFRLEAILRHELACEGQIRDRALLAEASAAWGA